MKYRTFVLLRNGILIGLVGLAGFGVFHGCQSANQAARPVASTAPAPPPVRRPAPMETRARQGETGAPAGPAAAGTPDRQPVSGLQREVIEMTKNPTTQGTSDGKSRKVRLKRGKTVVELRSDTAKGSKIWNRVKIDLNGNKQWDEAWDVKEDGKIKRRVAPADDESYTATYDLQGNTWVRRT